MHGPRAMSGVFVESALLTGPWWDRQGVVLLSEKQTTCRRLAHFHLFFVAYKSDARCTHANHAQLYRVQQACLVAH